MHGRKEWREERGRDCICECTHMPQPPSSAILGLAMLLVDAAAKKTKSKNPSIDFSKNERGFHKKTSLALIPFLHFQWSFPGPGTSSGQTALPPRAVHVAASWKLPLCLVDIENSSHPATHALCAGALGSAEFQRLPTLSPHALRPTHRTRKTHEMGVSRSAECHTTEK